jgi:flagellar assembly factor FliW
MLVKTRQFGEIEVEQPQVISFKEGILAFENIKQYILIPVENNPAFTWLQAVDEPELAFLLVDPFLVKNGYFVDIDDKTRKALEIEKQEDVLVYTTVTIPKSGFKKATTNLLAPLIINIQKKKAAQLVLDESHGSIKHPLFSPKNKLKASNE